MGFKERRTATEEIFHGKIINVRVDQVVAGDYPTTREVVEHPGGVGVLALDEGGNVLLVRQHRYAAGLEMLEIPAGKLAYGEDPAQCGRRELREETGCTAGKYEFLAKIHPTPAYDTEVIHLYLAQELEEGEQHLDPGEFLSVERVPLEQAVELCLNGGITDAKTLVAILKYRQMRQAAQAARGTDG